MRTAVIYSRISRDSEGRGLGVARQIDECRALAEREGYAVAGEYVDNDVSAYSGAPRPGFAELADHLRRGVDAVIAWHPDRLTRQPRELEDLIDLLEATGTRVVTVQSGAYDLSTPTGRMSARIVGSVARHESEHKSARLKAKARQLAAAGKVGGGGTRPFGYEDDRVTVREPEAAAVRWAISEVLAGATLRSVCRRMPMPTVTGAAWSPTVMRGMLLRARIAGLREHLGEVTADAEWPAIVDRDAWERCRVILSDPARRKYHAPTRYLLTGVAYDHLGRRMFARPSAGHKRRYKTLRDDQGPGITIDADELEAHVLRTVAEIGRSMAKLGSLTVGAVDGSATVADVTALEDELTALATLHGEGKIGLAEWMAARAGVEDRLTKARANLGSPGRVVDFGFLADVESATWDEQRRAVFDIFRAVVVGPAVRGRNRYDPDRVTFKLNIPLPAP